MKSGEWSRCKTRTRRSGQVVLHGYTLALRYRDQLKVGGKNIALIAIFMMIN